MSLWQIIDHETGQHRRFSLQTDIAHRGLLCDTHAHYLNGERIKPGTVMERVLTFPSLATITKKHFINSMLDGYGPTPLEDLRSSSIRKFMRKLIDKRCQTNGEIQRGAKAGSSQLRAKSQSNRGILPSALLIQSCGFVVLYS